MRQPTMADIAERAGVSRIAVSYALNDRPGVSAALRAEILRIAHELGYRANGSALALHGAAAGAFGLTLARPSAAVTIEVFRRQLITGIQRELSGRGYALALQFVDDRDEEMAVHRRWAAEQRVDGVLLIDPGEDDPRLPELARLGLPAVVAGGTPGMGGVWLTDTATMEVVTRYLTGLGHRRIARISGPAGMVHTAIRDEAFRRATAETVVVHGDYSPADGARLTRDLLAGDSAPTAIVYDNDIMAVAGLAAAQEAGVAVPSDLAIVAWEDSPMCRFVTPSLTVVDHDVAAFGAQAARLLFDRLADPSVPGVPAPESGLLIRRST